MGKSPGKWIKTVIFRKKSSKSSSQKPQKADVLEKEEVVSSKTLSFGDVARRTTVGAKESSENVRNLDSVYEIENLEKTLTDQQVEAVITAQAILRGYLVRRSFRATKGIVRLQALVRGHLVRRQAISTLRCTERIVRLQSRARGRRVRLSGVGCEVKKKFGSTLSLSGFSINPKKDKLSSNAFISKLVASSPTSNAPLRFRYDPTEPNSDWQWLERWTLFKSWDPFPQKKQKKSKKREVDIKINKKKGNIQIKKSDLSRLKQVEERVSTLNNRKLLSLSDLVHEKQTTTTSPRRLESKDQPQNELERVKQNLRRISASSKVALGSSMPRSAVETVPKPIEEKHDSAETFPLENCEEVIENSIPKLEEEESPKNEEETIWRSDVPPKKLEYAENVHQRSPISVPNYMMSTKSAKAKLRGFGSPRYDQDHEVENGGLILKRNSLPLYANGKSILASPQSERAVAKGESKSLISSVVGYGNMVPRPDWRR